MKRTVFLDTNIFLRYLRHDHPQWSPACRQVFKAIEEGTLHAWTSELVVAEIVFVLASKKHYAQSRPAIADALLALLFLPHLKLAHKRIYQRVFELFTTYPKLSYVDCYTAALVEAHSPRSELLSYDAYFDELATIAR